MSAGVRRHEIYGLRVDTALPCPELREVAAAGAADLEVAVEDGPGEPPVPRPTFDVLDGRLRLRTRFTADLVIEAGRHIRVAPRPGAVPSAVRNLLLGWGIGGALAQRGTLALHASAVVTPAGAVVLCGDGGAGKSTLAAVLLGLGFPVLDDNLAVLAIEAGGIAVQPGLGFIKLWRDALHLLPRDAHEVSRIGGKDKHTVQLRDPERGGRAPLARIVRITRGPAFAARPVPAAERVELLRRQTFLPHLLAPLGRMPAYFPQWLAAARTEILELAVPPLDTPGFARELAANVVS